MTPDRADVVIVGAGVIGLAIAWELLGRGREVVVCERDVPGAGASGAAAGMLAPTSEADLADDVLLAFAQDSLRRYPRLVAELEALTGISCGYRTEGTLWVALNQDDQADLAHLEAAQRARGLRPERLTGPDVQAREPRLSPRVVAGLWVPDDHQVDPRALVGALVAAFRARGGRLLTGTTVTGVRTAAGRIAGVAVSDPTGEREVGCRAAVLAAGAWTGAIATPEPALAVRPVKGQIVRLRGARLLDRVVRHPRVYLVPRRDGELVVGATMEEQGFDAAPTAGAVLELLRDAWAVLPGTFDLAVAELSVGLRPAVRDHLPAVGATATPGLFVATGHHRHGILLAPATAHYLAELVGRGVMPPALVPLDPARLAGDPAPAGRARSA